MLNQINIINSFLVEKAVRISLAGRPGAVYLDLPGDVLTGIYSEPIP